MDRPTRSPGPRPRLLAALVGASVLSNTVLIPAVRPLLTWLHGPDDAWMHAFMSVNMLGGAIGAPWLASLADRTGARHRIVVAAAAADGLLLLACALPLPMPVVLAIRTLQGAASIGALSLMMGSAAGARDDHARAIGLAGAAAMAGVALGAPVGTWLLLQHPIAPLASGAALALGIAAVLAVVGLGDRAPARERGSMRALLGRRPLLWAPVAWVASERFAVGCMVVSFSLYAHRALGLDDARVGGLYGWFLFPFVALTYPAARFAGGRARPLLAASGLAGYAIALALLGTAPAFALPAVMLLGGVSSAATYGASLRAVTSLAPAASRASSMALLHAGGSAGMLAGTALAGALSAILARSGWGPDRTYPLVFAIAGLAQLAALGGSAPALFRLTRVPIDAGGAAAESAA